MAQAIHCDYEGHQDGLADVMVSRLENGETSAWCFDHYVEVCRAVVETVESTVRAAIDQEAVDRLAGVTPPEGADQEPDGAPGAAEAGVSLGTPDLAVASFRPEGDQPEPQGVGGPETGDPGQAAGEPASGQPPEPDEASPAPA